VGIERVILNLKKQNISVPPLPGLKVLIASMGDAAGEAAVRLAGELRRTGISAAAVGGGRSLKAQLRQANALGVAATVIIGEDEVRAGTASLRLMADARQETVPLADLPHRLKSRL
jgi:histidyl-tRNA synthetase